MLRRYLIWLALAVVCTGMAVARPQAPAHTRALQTDDVATAAGTTSGFTLVPAVLNCPALCAGTTDPETIHGGAAGKNLCAEFGVGHDIHWGTWHKGICRLFNGTDGTAVAAPSGYWCACQKANATYWKKDLACVAGPKAAAKGPGVCKIVKPGGGDYALGWIETGSNRCNVYPVPWGAGGSLVTTVKGVGGKFNMQILCANNPSGSAGPGPKGFSVTRVKPSCKFTCAAQGPFGSSPITGGNPNTWLCAHIDTALGQTYYGVCLNEHKPFQSWYGGDGNFYFSRAGKTVYMPDGYHCACAPLLPRLVWRASSKCVSGGALAAASGPAVCRMRNPNGSGFAIMGWMRKGKSGQVCSIWGMNWGPGGSQVHYAVGLGGPYRVQALCRDNSFFPGR